MSFLVIDFSRRRRRLWLMKTGVESAFSCRKPFSFSRREPRHLCFAKQNSKAWRWIHLRTFGNCYYTAMLFLMKSLSFTDSYTSKNPNHWSRWHRFSRMKSKVLTLLKHALQMPLAFHCQQRRVCDNMGGLHVHAFEKSVLPLQVSDMIPQFGRPASVMPCNKSYLKLHLQKPWTTNTRIE